MLIFFIFLLGIICGKVGIDTMSNALVSSLSNLELIQIVGCSSSVATLILFILYFCGKYFIIKQMKNTIFENVVRYDSNPINLRVVEEYNVGENNSEQLFIYSSNSLNWIKVYECSYDDNKKIFVKNKLIIKHGYLRNGFSIKINTYLPCGLPSYILEYQRFDFIIGSLLLSENGKNGIVDEGLSIKHTFKSLLYYLVK